VGTCATAIAGTLAKHASMSFDKTSAIPRVFIVHPHALLRRSVKERNIAPVIEMRADRLRWSWWRSRAASPTPHVAAVFEGDQDAGKETRRSQDAYQCFLLISPGMKPIFTT
jgi:hypothetical protein